MTESYSMQSSIIVHKCEYHNESWTLKLKTTHSHHKIISKLNEICWRRLVWLAATLCKVVWLELHVVPRQEPDPKNKTSCSHYKILSKLIEICWKWLIMTSSYSVQSWVARTTRGPRVKSRTLEIKPRIHTIKFYQNWQKFVGDDSV